MLNRLSIDNYALIDHVNINFDSGLSIITGQTGAGKSIILGALSLLLGVRADSKSVAHREKKTVVEAIFQTRPDLKHLFDENALDWDENEIIVRREISPQGRSRAFINDTPVNLKFLAEVTSRLVDIHSQNSNRMLSCAQAQLEIIDAVADNSNERADYRAAFKQYVKLRSKLRSLKNRIAANKENEEFVRFQLEQLDALKPKAGELQRLEQEAEILSDAEDMHFAVETAASLLNNGENGVTASLAEVRHTLSRINLSLLETDSPDSAGLQQRLESIYVEVKDIGASLLEMSERLNADPQRLANIEKRISDLYEAMHRFNANSDTDLANLHKELRQRLAPEANPEEELKQLESEAKHLAARLKTKADALTATRHKSAERFSELLTSRARLLGMENLKFSAMLTKGKLSADGQDEVCFLCAFNKNQELRPVASVASGGETSRLMLSIKAIIARHVQLPSIIFDEVDTGVSGEIADRMGAIMREMANDIQVIAITHLPQVAAKGHRHYMVYKTDNESSTVTHIRPLSEPEREEELARMLSGAELNEAALQNARTLLQNNTQQS